VLGVEVVNIVTWGLSSNKSKELHKVENEFQIIIPDFQWRNVSKLFIFPTLIE